LLFGNLHYSVVGDAAAASRRVAHAVVGSGVQALGSVVAALVGEAAVAGLHLP